MALTHTDGSRTEPPLWSIGLAVLLILLSPVVLYSLAPSGPLREGDTVFSNGEQRVTLVVAPTGSAFQQEETCLLDPGNPLIILEQLTSGQAWTARAEVQGNPAHEWPFCPPHAEILIESGQAVQTQKVLESMTRSMARWFSR